jgi:signal transduction histidine kinase
VARRLAQDTRDVADARGALARARRRALAVAAADGRGPDGSSLGALVLAADVVVSLALERDWGRDEIDVLARDLARLLDLPAENVGIDLFFRAVADPRLLEPPPQLALETELRLLSAFCAVDDASIWIADDRQRPRLLAHVGVEPTRSMRGAAAEALAGRDRAAVAATLRTFPVTRWDRVEGALVVRVPRTDKRALALAGELAARLPANVERARLLERRTERESALVEAAERRLARLGFDLHDGPVQEIVALGAELRLFREQLRRTLGGHRNATIILGRVDDLEARLVALDGELREVARSLESPTVLRTPLPELLRAEAAHLEEQAGLAIDLHLSGDLEALTASQAIVLLRVVQEALANVESHSSARSASVTVTAGAEELRAEVLDDGQGFEVEQTLVAAARGGRLGLVGMSERVRLLEGRLDVESRPGGPTRVAAVIPRWRPPA